VSYPDPKYHADIGEISGTFRAAGDEPELAYTRSGTTVHYLATGASTQGEFGLYRWTMGPGPGGPDPHFHKAISESFYVLSGVVSLYDGNRWIDGAPGDFLFIPEGGLHAFKNHSGEVASMLLLFAPGAPREDYFETLEKFGQGLTMTDEERQEFFLRHDTYWQ
jgi:quercetin dioxygenase-like cupin family protein